MATLSMCTASQSANLAGLADIRSPDCNLAIWDRSGLSGVTALMGEQAKDIRFSTSLANLEGQLASSLAESDFADLPLRNDLIDDVAMLAEAYAAIMDIKDVEVRLEVVTTNSCRKWHADYVKARLITTYVGTGTQWLDGADADRVKRGNEPLQINEMQSGAVGIFKGKLWTETPAVHRSPPIEGTGERRLLLVINPAESR